MNSHMITFSGDQSRLNNYSFVKENNISDLKKFDAIDTVNNYDYWKNKALKENWCTEKYTSSQTDKIPGKLGCNLSYLNLFSNIISSSPDREWHLIIEDDIKIEEGFTEFISLLLKTLEKVDTEYVSLYGDPSKNPEQFIPRYHIKDNLYSMIPQYYTLAQLIRTSGMKKILWSLPMDENIDLWRNNNINLLSCTIANNNLISNLGSPTESAHLQGEKSKMGSLIWDSAKKPSTPTAQPRQILFQMHIMWYESAMINETLDSILAALDRSTIPVKVVLGLNAQTYLEKPIKGKAEEMFSVFLDHPLIKHKYTTVYHITDAQPFYNIGDWRRDVYNPDSIYTVWGESDCLLPVDYFETLSSLADQINSPHFVTLASRKMWDSTWQHVEHPEVRSLPLGPDRNNIEELYSHIPPHLSSEKQITQSELNDFNDKYPPAAKKLPFHKVDGSLLAISKSFPTPFIGEKVHFAREDTCFEMFCRLKNIPQYLIETKIKGHNYKHPLKRTNTTSSRDDSEYKSYEQDSIKEINFFLKSLSQASTPQPLQKEANSIVNK